MIPCLKHAAWPVIAYQASLQPHHDYVSLPETCCLASLPPSHRHSLPVFTFLSMTSVYCEHLLTIMATSSFSISCLPCTAVLVHMLVHIISKVIYDRPASVVCWCGVKVWLASSSAAGVLTSLQKLDLLLQQGHVIRCKSAKFSPQARKIGDGVPLICAGVWHAL